MTDQTAEKPTRSSAGASSNVPLCDVTEMPVQTHSEHWAVVSMGMGDSVVVRDKKSPDGRPTFASGTIMRTMTKAGEIKSQKSASVNVIEPPQNGEVYEFGQMYRGDGAIWVQPWESNGRIALSITVERLVPLK